MWERFKRALRAIFGGWISSMEDPALILEQNIRDMRDKIPKMNENIAMIKANVTMLQREIQKLSDNEKNLIAQVKSAIQNGRDDIAAEYATQIEHARAQKARAEGQLKTAEVAAKKAEDVKKAFMKELEKKTKEALAAIETAKRAQWQKEVADTMEQFEVGGIDHTHNEMVNRIEKDSAVSEAKLDMALSKVDSDRVKIEEDAEKIKGQELVKQFKIEMGMMDTPAQKTENKEQIKN